ncbi:unnamed protein product [Rangifer tarandus platyrhynchus]|uniref:Uncharacterized protein n=2 Tax=Rangifer tarandus platyrhynchus TaxID=3082113 RepID=A0ACB0E827_RANTA|nr:unnamed protein product [Rangifer tarandus platyrhynchus]CAI9696812.1 unnamed protein product [Rangifer tarandus platyrhynchus]
MGVHLPGFLWRASGVRKARESGVRTRQAHASGLGRFCGPARPHSCSGLAPSESFATASGRGGRDGARQDCSVAASGACALVAPHRPLGRASPVVGPGLCDCGSRDAVAPDTWKPLGQGPNLCPLHRQAHAKPLDLGMGLNL